MNWLDSVGSALRRDPDVLAIEQQSPSQLPPVVLELERVGLDIPVFTTETRSLKSSLIRSVTGGRLKRKGSGAVVTALELSVTIRQEAEVL